MTTIPQDLLTNWEIMVVDDEDDSLEVARYILTFYGATVHTAVNGVDALKVLETVRPRFIISDISMPQMDGWALIAKIQENIALKDVPVIALTAHAMRGDREKAISAGFHNYLIKPLTPSTFMAQLVRLLMDIPQFEGQFKNVEL
jgi:CheY-like chemotaxis protein